MTSLGSSSEWQKDHGIRPLFEIRSPCDELQIRDDSTNRHVELVGIHQAGKSLSCFLPPRRFREQIFILREEHPSPLAGAAEESRVEKLGGSVSCAVRISIPRRRSPSITARRT